MLGLTSLSAANQINTAHFTHLMSAHQLYLHLQIEMISEEPHITVQIYRFTQRTRKVTLLP